MKIEVINKSDLIEVLRNEFIPLISKLQKGVNTPLNSHNSSSTLTPTNEYLTKKEAASYAKCSVSTIDNYRRRGILNVHYLGSQVRIKRSELERVMSNNKDIRL